MRKRRRWIRVFPFDFQTNRPDFDNIVLKLREKLSNSTKEDQECVDSVLVRFLHENDMEVVATQVANLAINDDESKGKNSSKSKKE